MAKVGSLKDFLMLLLYAKGHTGKQCEPIRGRTRLMKMVFLFNKEIRRQFNLDKVIPQEALPDFIAYDYGPFSAEVYSNLEFLVELGFVEVCPVEGKEMSKEEAREYSYWQASTSVQEERAILVHEEEFRLSSLGREFVEQGEAGRLTANQRKVMDEFKARCTATSLKALLRYVYTRYPQIAGESKIRDEIVS